MANHRLQVRVSESLHRRVCAVAGRSRVPLEVWIRQTIEERLERESGDSRADALAALRRLDAPTAEIDVMIAEIAAGRS